MRGRSRGIFDHHDQRDERLRRSLGAKQDKYDQQSPLFEDHVRRAHARWARRAVEIIDAYLARDKARIGELMPTNKPAIRLVIKGTIEVVDRFYTRFEYLDVTGKATAPELTRYLNELAPDELEADIETFADRLACPDDDSGAPPMDTYGEMIAWAHASCAHAAALAAHCEESVGGARATMAELLAIVDEELA